MLSYNLKVPGGLFETAKNIKEGAYKVMDRPKLFIIIPCYNEEEVLPVTAPKFKEELDVLRSKALIADDSRIMFVDDGSSDSTWKIIKDLSDESPDYSGLRLSRNRGHQNALLAGLLEARKECDITISIDCDGQDDITAMEKMVEEYHKGADIVYGVRSKRKTDTFFKRSTAQLYYKLLSAMGAEVVYNHADYRLASSVVLDELADFEEVNLYLRGMFPLIGFKSAEVPYERHERLAGKTRYPLSKMLSLAMNGITNLSVKPIRIITGLGLGVALVSFILLIYTLVRYFMGVTVEGWASTAAIICFMSGVQLICLGVIGEYIGKIYMESKRRPRYIVRERTDKDN